MQQNKIMVVMLQGEVSTSQVSTRQVSRELVKFQSLGLYLMAFLKALL